MKMGVLTLLLSVLMLTPMRADDQAILDGLGAYFEKCKDLEKAEVTLDWGEGKSVSFSSSTLMRLFSQAIGAKSYTMRPLDCPLDCQMKVAKVELLENGIGMVGLTLLQDKILVRAYDGELRKSIDLTVTDVALVKELRKWLK